MSVLRAVLLLLVLVVIWALEIVVTLIDWVVAARRPQVWR
jgi:hypothetical protein